MPTYPVRALTLRRWRRRDADRVYRILTEDRGMLDVAVHGAAKINSKLAGHLEPYAEVRLLLARTRGPYRVANAVLQRRFVGDDLATGQRLAQVASVAEQLLNGEQGHPGAFDAVAEAWAQLCAGDPGRQAEVAAEAALRLCALTGYRVPAEAEVPPEPRRLVEFVNGYLASVLPYPFRLG